MKRKLKELMNRALRKEEGFTLVEIIVVIVIMAILAAIAVPSVLGYINDANNAKYIAEARAIYLACQVEETKYNASAGNISSGYVYAGSTADDALVTSGTVGKIEGNVIAKMAQDGSSGITVSTISYTPVGEEVTDPYYTINFNASDGEDKTATVKANDEITVN